MIVAGCGTLLGRSVELQSNDRVKRGTQKSPPCSLRKTNEINGLRPEKHGVDENENTVDFLESTINLALFAYKSTT
jgi:hypothetical protein